MRRIQEIAVLALLSVGLAFAAPVTAQSGTTAVVTGTVQDAFGRPLPGALVTLTALDRGGSREMPADASGGFRFTLVAPGSYEVRAEALGYRPVVARTLSLTAGARPDLSLNLAQAPPPVLTVDTVAVGVAAGSRFDADGLRLGVADLDRPPHRFDDPVSVAVLDPTLDASFGAQGLPGALTLIVVDGVPVYAAPHPTAGAEQQSGPAFPRSSLSSVLVPQSAPDVDWPGTAGGRIGLTTLTGTPGQGLVLEGGWSGAPLWSSDQLDVSKKPGLLSFNGAARTTIAVTPGESQVVLAGEAMRQETPLVPRASEAVATSLTGLDADLVASLSSPSVERYSRYSGLVRFDSFTETAQLFVRGAAGFATREFDGPGPVALDPAAAPAEETVEYSVASGYLRETESGPSMEVRLGLSGADRTFAAAHEGVPAALLVGSGARLGIIAGGQGKSSRTDIVLTPSLRWDLGGGQLKVGLASRLSRSSLLREATASYMFSDGPELVLGQGYLEGWSSSDAAFWTYEVGGYVQYEAELSPRLRATAGVRYDRESVAGSGATLNTDLLQATGLRNDAYPGGFNQLGGVLGFTWDPEPSTRLFARFSVSNGDLDSRLVAELFSKDVGATQTTFAGPGLTWPGGAVPSGATTLPTVTLFGPDTRAPRSMQASAGVIRHVLAGWSLHVGGSVRRTDFLMRRRNLNIPVTAPATDPWGRNVFGTLQQDGALITATGSDARRIDSFGALWALDPDGWSKYWDATAGLEYDGGTGRFFVAYTRSRTTDNWLGSSGLSPLLPESGWSEGTSDYDVPNRITATASVDLSLTTLSAAYRYRSGLPFTPRYRTGVDANGDGSVSNDVAYVDAVLVDALLSEWPCLDDQIGGFAVRNSCRGSAVHSLDVRLQVRVGQLGGRDASLVLDAFNLVESEGGVVDDALLLVDPSGSITSSGGTVTTPLMVNPGFGSVLYETSRGRMLRVGFRIG